MEYKVEGKIENRTGNKIGNKVENKIENKKGNKMEDRIKQELAQHGYTAPTFLGKGAASCVWRVWDENKACFLACKISAAGKRAEREADMLKGLQHPAFPQYRQAWSRENTHFLVMEYVPGKNLREIVRRRGHLSEKQAVRIAMELAEGLIFLHERSVPVLFRDIKPENVMLRQDGRVKLIDVGCACREGDSLTIGGSRGYGAPEQFVQAGCPGVESDVYAMGKLFAYMLTGQEEGQPGTEGYPRDSRWKGVSRGLRRLIEEAVCVERRMRVPDMRTFLQRLSVYDGAHPLRRVSADWQAKIRRGRAADFYYVQNVRRGMER